MAVLSSKTWPSPCNLSQLTRQVATDKMFTVWKEDSVTWKLKANITYLYSVYISKAHKVKKYHEIQGVSYSSLAEFIAP
jgi:hypothetical protein